MAPIKGIYVVRQHAFSHLIYRYRKMRINRFWPVKLQSPSVSLFPFVSKCFPDVLYDFKGCILIKMCWNLERSTLYVIYGVDLNNNNSLCKPADKLFISVFCFRDDDFDDDTYWWSQSPYFTQFFNFIRHTLWNPLQ